MLDGPRKPQLLAPRKLSPGWSKGAEQSEKQMIEKLLNDVRYGAKMLWKSKGLTIVAIVPLGRNLIRTEGPARRATKIDPMEALRY